MFKKRESPELYEVLKHRNLDVGKNAGKEITLGLGSKPAEKASSQEKDDYNSPQTIPELTSPRPYPKLRSPFPVKLDRMKKPADRKPSSGANNYSGILLLLLIVVIVAFIIYAIWFSGSKTTDGAATAGTSGATTAGTGDTGPRGIPPPPPAPVVKTWSIRLIYYEDNAVGQQSTEKMLRFLNDKNAAGIFVRKEKLDGVKSLVFYQGNYNTREEANKNLSKYQKLHYGFKKCSAVEVNK
ncbi:MAG: hypothetical protein WC980_04645 [Candidatus Brocadiia bacterium]